MLLKVKIIVPGAPLTCFNDGRGEGSSNYIGKRSNTFSPFIKLIGYAAFPGRRFASNAKVQHIQGNPKVGFEGTIQGGTELPTV